MMAYLGYVAIAAWITAVITGFVQMHLLVVAHRECLALFPPAKAVTKADKQEA